jgi:hypothetical protein
MSPLAFDKQGKPFSWHPRTAKLRVRLFRNPAARGTCCQVLDAAGSALFVEADIEYTEFRRITGNVPGLYRLDQCDEDDVEIDGAAAAYLTIDPLRNGGAFTSETGSSLDVNALAIIDRLVTVQERMVASQADVMKQMAAQHGVLMNAGSVVMNASAEIMRAPYRAPRALPEPRNAGNGDEENEDEDDERDDVDEPVESSNPFNIAMSFITPEMAHQLGAGATEKIIEAFRKIFGTKPTAVAPAAAPAPAFVPPMAPAPAAPQVNVAQSGVAAGPSSRPVASVVVGSMFEAFEPRFADADGAEHDEFDVDAAEADEAAAPVTPTAPNASLMQAGSNPLISNTASGPPVAPTQEQFAHLVAIYQRLSPAERAVAQRAVAQMNVATRGQWIAIDVAMAPAQSSPRMTSANAYTLSRFSARRGGEANCGWRKRYLSSCESHRGYLSGRTSGGTGAR